MSERSDDRDEHSVPGLVARLLDQPLVVLALFVVATVGMTWPLALQIGTHLPAYEGDLWTEVWAFWWWKAALLDRLVSPYSTDMLFHPDGVSLAFYSHSPVNILATLPVSVAIGPEAAYMTALLAGFALSGFTTYLLVRELTDEPRAAVIAGLLFAFSPMHFEQSLEHMGVASVQFIPLLALFALRVVRRPGPGNAVGLGLSYAACALVTWYWAVIGVFLAATLVGRELWAGRHRRSFAAAASRLATAAAIAAVVVVPFAWPMMGELAAGSAADPRFHDLGVDAGFWLLPSEHNPLFGSLVAGVRERFATGVTTDRLSYLGFIPVALVTLAMARRSWGGPERGVWIFLLIVFLLLALGAHPKVLGRELSVAFPHAAFEGLPLVGRLRVANRFQLWAFLPIAVLAGFVLARLFRLRRPFLAWGLGGAILLEYLWVPYPTRPIDPHPFLSELSRPALFALAERETMPGVLPIPLPIDYRYSQALHDQTRHGRPIVGGYVSYLPPEPRRKIAQSAFLAGLVARPPNFRPPKLAELQRLEIGVVLVHLDRTESARYQAFVDSGRDFYARQRMRLEPGFPDKVMEAVRDEMRRLVGPPLYADDRLEVYVIPERGAALTR